MRVLVIHFKEINYYPPVKSLINSLIELGYTVTIICYDGFGYAEEMHTNYSCRVVNLKNYKKQSKMGRLSNIFLFNSRINNLVKQLMNDHDLIWTTTDNTVASLSNILPQFSDRHIMQLMELIGKTPRYYYKFLYKLGIQNLITVDMSQFAQRARCVVVPEINRAYITQAMWNLERLPTVLPNKPYYNLDYICDVETQSLVNKLRSINKKIILYQGVFLKERKLDEIAEAVRMLGDSYILCIMGRDSDERKALCSRYPEILYIPFVKPPFHLCVTQLAHIGILTYFPAIDDIYDKLNVIYCAPNKLYEYAHCGLPMIGNNIPGLKLPFENYGIGVCFDNFTAHSIVKAIKTIERGYEAKRVACERFFNSIDIKEIVRGIIN